MRVLAGRSILMGLRNNIALDNMEVGVVPASAQQAEHNGIARQAEATGIVD